MVELISHAFTDTTVPAPQDASNSPSHAQLLALFRQMLRIRRVQLRIESRYHLDEMKTPVHLYIGQEAIATGVCAHLHREDNVCGNHRGHGHYLAKGGDLPAMIAELHCRQSGCAHGHGGSMHLVDCSVGLVGNSAIVGGGIPIATGLALAAQMQAQDRVSVAFFGDGAADEGTLYESVNFAILKKLPVVFVLENNQFSVCSRVGARRRGSVVFLREPPDLLFSAQVDGNDVLAVWRAAGEAIGRARAGGGPGFLDCLTYRMRGHAGAGSDAKLGYRTEEEIAAWARKDPVETFRETLMRDGVLSAAALEEMERAIEAEIDAAFRFALESELPKGRDVTRFLFKE